MGHACGGGIKSSAENTSVVEPKVIFVWSSFEAQYGGVELWRRESFTTSSVIRVNRVKLNHALGMRGSHSGSLREDIERGVSSLVAEIRPAGAMAAWSTTLSCASHRD